MWVVRCCAGNYLFIDGFKLLTMSTLRLRWLVKELVSVLVKASSLHLRLLSMYASCQQLCLVLTAVNVAELTGATTLTVSFEEILTERNCTLQK